MSDDRNVGMSPPLVEFHALLLSVLPSLRQQAARLTRQSCDAEDLVQLAIASALSAQASFSIGTNFRAWIGCILRNHFLSGVRRRRSMVDLDNVPVAYFSRTGGQEEHVEVQDLGRHMLRLPADHILILLMISLDEISYQLAAERLGVPEGTLKSRVYRARRQLEQWMSATGTGDCISDTADIRISKDTAASAGRVDVRRPRTYRGRKSTQNQNPADAPGTDMALRNVGSPP